MRKMMSIILLLCLALPGAAAACGGFFPVQSTILQSGQSVVFAVDHQAQKVSAYLSLSYTGDAEEFAWVVPVPNNPKMELSTAKLFEELDLHTMPIYSFPSNDGCFELSDVLRMGRDGMTSGAPPGAGVNVHQQGELGPYDYVVIGSEDANALTGWLRENGYRVAPEAEPLIQLYTDEKMLFVAMKLRGGKDSSAIQPVKLTFQGTIAMLPLRFSAVAAQPETQVHVWVFDETQVAPEGIDRILISDDDVFLTESGNSYDDALRSATQAVNGRGFVTEYAQPTSDLKTTVEDGELGQLFEKHAFLTRMAGRLAPEQMTFDPVFIASPSLALVENYHNLHNRVSPRDCSGKLRSAGEQLVLKNSAHGMWLEYSHLLPYLIIPILLIFGLLVVLRRRSRA